MQAGQVLTSVTVDENMTKDQAVHVLESVLNDINNMLKQQMNITDENANLVRISQADFVTPCRKLPVQRIRSWYASWQRRT